MGEIDRPRLHLIPADLSLGRLPREALAATDFDPRATSFWIAEGLLMYFPETIVQALLGSIQSLTVAGSGLAFSFMQKRADGRLRFQRQGKLVDWWLDRRGEPFRWAGSRDEVSAILSLWQDVAFFDEENLRALGALDPAVPLATGEIICSAIR